MENPEVIPSKNSSSPKTDNFEDGVEKNHHFELIKKNVLHQVSVQKNHISWWKKSDVSKKTFLDWNAVAGVKRDVRTITLTTCILPKNERKGKRKLKLFQFEGRDEQEASLFERVVSTLVYPKNKRRLLFIINPFSGKKTAQKVFDTVKPVLNVANIEIETIETKHAGHAKEIGYRTNLKEFDGFICVSGDGVFHELINGIMDRKDWKKAIKKQIGIIPAGTGNSLASSLGFGPLEAALAVAKGYTRPLDLWRVIQGDNIFWSFLGVHWGLLCDVDVESEKFRWLGDTRYDIYGLMYILEFHVYGGRLCFLRDSESLEKTRCDADVSKCSICNQYVGSVKNKNSKKKQKKQKEEYVFQEYEEHETKEKKEKNKRGPPFIIPHSDFNSPPPGWETIDGSFSYFVTSNMPYVSKDALPTPWAHLSDGFIDIVFGQKDKVGRYQLLMSMLSGFQDGTYAERYEDLLVYLKVKAFTLVPSVERNRRGNISIDGEPVAYEPIGAECHQGLLSSLIAPAPFLFESP